MTQSTKTADILNSLEPLFETAKRKKLWFHCNYQDLWFSPQELRENHAEGRFIWGPQNWTLRNPQELINQIKTEIKGNEVRLEQLQKRISKEGYSLS